MDYLVTVAISCFLTTLLIMSDSILYMSHTCKEFLVEQEVDCMKSCQCESYTNDYFCTLSHIPRACFRALSTLNLNSGKLDFEQSELA